jgi:hypothetical protein
VTRRIRSPGRARHKPSSHCAGNAGLPPLNLYARVRFFAQLCTRDRGCSAHPAFPAPSSFERDNVHANLGQILPREYCLVHSPCIQSNLTPTRRPGQASTASADPGPTITNACIVQR